MEMGKIENWADIRELALMSIGTDKGSWWADPSFGSDLWKLRQSGKIDAKTIGTVQEIILDSINWLKEDGLVSIITCTAIQSGKNTIAYCVELFRPDGSNIAIKENWNGI